MDKRKLIQLVLGLLLVAALALTVAACSGTTTGGGTPGPGLAPETVAPGEPGGPGGAGEMETPTPGLP